MAFRLPRISIVASDERGMANAGELNVLSLGFGLHLAWMQTELLGPAMLAGGLSGGAWAGAGPSLPFAAAMASFLLTLLFAAVTDQKLLPLYTAKRAIFPAAGLAALGEHKYVARLRAVIQAERPWLAGQLADLGLQVLPGSANYLLLYSETELAAPLRKLGVLIRDCSNYPGLDKGWYRVAVRTRRENRQLIAALRKVCGCENG